MVRDRRPQTFTNRIDAGQQLAAEMNDRNVCVDIVLAIPRGALPLGHAVADEIDAPLDIVAAQKIGALSNPELAIGAVVANGSTWLNNDVIKRQNIDDEYIEQNRKAEKSNAQQKAEQYRNDGSFPDLQGKTVVVVDDGIATGATARACIERVRTDDPERVVLAVPVGPPNTIAEFESEVDEVICLETPEEFRAIGQFYEEFEQVSDEEAMEYLDEE